MIWYRIVGDAPVHYRYFSVFMCILTLPFLFLLAKELFKSNLAGWIAISLFSVSPLIQYYAHEARYHMLLTFLLIALHYFFIMAISHQKIKWWIGYSIFGILSLYASVMSSVVILGHLLYVMIFKRRSRILFLINASVILLVYLPWLVRLVINREEIISSLSWQTWYGQNQDFWKLFIFQLTDLSHFFMYFTDFLHYHRLPLYNDFQGNYIELISNCIVLIVIIYSVIYTLKKSTKELFYLLVLIFLPYYLFMYISDLIRGSGMSLYWRYHDIYFIGIFLFMVCFLALKIQQKKLFSFTIYMGLVIIGLISILINVNNKCWDTFQYCEEHVKKASLISDSKNALLITDNPGIESIRFMTLINACESENIDILRASHDIENAAELISEKSYADIYVTHASSELIENLKTQFGDRMDSLEIEGISSMWKISL
jgi:4-amino-4-deoxy-L-arabinose transferase-like glycosyltransferase